MILKQKLLIGKINNESIDYNRQKRKIIVSTYFLNFSEKLLSRGTFHSDYWGDLIRKIHEWGFDIEWLHTFSTDNKNFRQNINRIRSIRKKNEKTLGTLFCFFILETILLGKSLNLNPYDQPAVELIKQETKKILI